MNLRIWIKQVRDANYQPTLDEIRKELTAENLRWWREQPAAWADHERLANNTKKALREVYRP